MAAAIKSVLKSVKKAFTGGAKSADDLDDGFRQLQTKRRLIPGPQKAAFMDIVKLRNADEAHVAKVQKSLDEGRIHYVDFDVDGNVRLLNDTGKRVDADGVRIRDDGTRMTEAELKNERKAMASRLEECGQLARKFDPTDRERMLREMENATPDELAAMEKRYDLAQKWAKENPSVFQSIKNNPKMAFLGATVLGTLIAIAVIMGQKNKSAGEAAGEVLNAEAGVVKSTVRTGLGMMIRTAMDGLSDGLGDMWGELEEGTKLMLILGGVALVGYGVAKLYFSQARTHTQVSVGHPSALPPAAAT